MMKRGVSHVQLLRKLTWRTAILLLIGFCFLNYGPTDGPCKYNLFSVVSVVLLLLNYAQDHSNLVGRPKPEDSVLRLK